MHWFKDASIVFMSFSPLFKIVSFAVFLLKILILKLLLHKTKQDATKIFKRQSWNLIVSLPWKIYPYVLVFISETDLKQQGCVVIQILVAYFYLKHHVSPNILGQRVKFLIHGDSLSNVIVKNGRQELNFIVCHIEQMLRLPEN